MSEHLTHCITQKDCPHHQGTYTTTCSILHGGVEGTCALLGLLLSIDKVPHCLLSVCGFCVCHVAAGFTLGVIPCPRGAMAGRCTLGIGRLAVVYLCIRWLHAMQH